MFERFRPKPQSEYVDSIASLNRQINQKFSPPETGLDLAGLEIEDLKQSFHSHLRDRRNRIPFIPSQTGPSLESLLNMAKSRYEPGEVEEKGLRAKILNNRHYLTGLALKGAVMTFAITTTWASLPLLESFKEGFAASAPTPQPGAMTVIQYRNFDTSTDVQVSLTITDTNRTYATVVDTVPSCTNGYKHLRDIAAVPSPFTGSATASANSPFVAIVIDYDYPISPTIPTDAQKAQWADHNGSGDVDAGDVQKAAWLYGTNICNSLYEEPVDIANANNDVDMNGKPRPQGEIGGNTVQAHAASFGKTYPPSASVQRSLSDMQSSATRFLGLVSGPAVRLDGPFLLPQGQLVTMTLTTDFAAGLSAFNATVDYDPTMLQLVNNRAVTGRNLNPDPKDEKPGSKKFGASEMTGLTPDSKGRFRVETLVFTALKPGKATVKLTDARLFNARADQIPTGVWSGADIYIAPGVWQRIYLPVIGRDFIQPNSTTLQKTRP